MERHGRPDLEKLSSKITEQIRKQNNKKAKKDLLATYHCSCEKVLFGLDITVVLLLDLFRHIFAGDDGNFQCLTGARYDEGEFIAYGYGFQQGF